MTRMRACGGTVASIKSTCASAAVRMLASGTGSAPSWYGAVRNFCCTLREFLAPVFERKTYGVPLSMSHR
eukprot:scaffold43097_cov62-Phaeocystis_antarctica.AAC.5